MAEPSSPSAGLLRGLPELQPLQKSAPEVRRTIRLTRSGSRRGHDRVTRDDVALRYPGGRERGGAPRPATWQDDHGLLTSLDQAVLLMGNVSDRRGLSEGLHFSLKRPVGSLQLAK